LRIEEARLIVRPGPGLVARYGPVVLLVAQSDHPAAAELVAAARNTDVAAGVEMMFEVVRRKRPELVTPFCAVIQDGDELRVAVNGAIEVLAVARDSTIRVAGRDATSGVEESLGAEVSVLAIGDQPPDPAAGPLLDLVEGVVPAASITLVPRAPLATPAVAPAAVPETVAGQQPPPVEAAVAEIRRAATIAHQTLGPAPEHVEAPEVEGRLCTNGHLNNPSVGECWVCGAAVGAETARGPRPPLGRLTTKDKKSYIVDTNFVIGRRPGMAEDVAAGRARPIEVPDEHHDVSRRHAELNVEGWDLILRDLGSSNGTYYLVAGATDWVRVQPAQPVKIESGTIITLGGYEILFESV
jgi:hypothetical protein